MQAGGAGEVERRAPARAPAEQSVPGFRLWEPIGYGTGSTVYRAEPVDGPGRVVAVKIVPGADHRLFERLHDQAVDLAGLHHPALIRLHGIIALRRGVAVVMDYLAGGSLADRIRAREHGLDPMEVARVGRRIAEALDRAHTASVLHRDVKPSNVLFTAGGAAVLADFAPEPDRGVVGTAEYLDPTLLTGARPGPAADIYSLGVTLYEALSGRPAFGGPDAEATLEAAREARWVPLVQRAPDAPLALVAAVERAMARSPADRPADAGELAAALGRVGGHRGRGPAGPGATRRFGPRPPPPSRPAAGADRRRWWLVVLAAVVALVPVVTAVWLLNGGL